jgi:alpha-beta hydrolase superfamily lysophospholipase
LGEAAGSYTIEEFKASDGYRLRYRRYQIPGPARAEVLFIHGIQSHAGWYEYSCSQLARAGFAVTFLDRRGSGLNEAERGDAPSFRRLLDDLAEYLEDLPRGSARTSNPLTPPTGGQVFLGAISWGGKLAVALERRHPGLVNGLMLLCPGFFPRVYPSLGQRLKIVVSRFFRPRRLFDLPLNDPDLFTATPRWQQFLHDDPMRLHRGTARLLLESARLDGYLRFVPRYVHVPVLVLLAENDRIINNVKTRAYVERFATPDKRVIEYPVAHHTLEFEPQPDIFIADLREWMEQHIGGTTS